MLLKTEISATLYSLFPKLVSVPVETETCSASEVKYKSQTPWNTLQSLSLIVSDGDGFTVTVASASSVQPWLFETSTV